MKQVHNAKYYILKENRLNQIPLTIATNTHTHTHTQQKHIHTANQTDR